MELTLNIYEDRLCRKVEKTVTASEFSLSTAICEDVLNVINIDMWEGGIQSLDTEALLPLVIPIIRNGFPFFVQLVAEIFEITEKEAKHTKLSEMAKVLIDIVMYAMDELKPLATSKNSKN